MDRKCILCGQHVPTRKSIILDGKVFCHPCMYQQSEPFLIYPIGYVRNQLKRAESGFGVDGDSKLSKIELFPSQKPFLYKIEEEKELTIVFYLHKARPVRSRFKRGYDGKVVGLFATRTPDRPSRIAIQDVRLIKVNDLVLTVEGLDAIDGSPVLDIKMKWHAR